MQFRRAAILATLALGAVAALHLARCSEAKAGRLVTEPTALDFGQVVVRDVVPRKLVLRNEGPHPVFIASVFSNCGCLRIPKFPRSLEPGQSKELVLTLDAKRLTPMRLKGKKFEIVTNDPKAKHLVLPVEAEIVGTHDMKPLFVELQTLDAAGREREHRIELRGHPGVKVEVQEVRVLPPGVLETSIRRLDGGSDVVVRVGSDAPAGRGRLKARLEIVVGLTLPNGVQRTRTEVVPVEGNWP